MVAASCRPAATRTAAAARGRRCTGSAPTTGHAHRVDSSASTATSRSTSRTAARRSRSRRPTAAGATGTRTDGDDAGAMVTDELLPLLQQRGYDTAQRRLPGLVDGRLRRAPARRTARFRATTAWWPAVRRCGATPTRRPAPDSPTPRSTASTASSTARRPRRHPGPRRRRHRRPVLPRRAGLRRRLPARRRRPHLRAGRAHLRLLAPDAARPARRSWAASPGLAAAGVEGDVPVVALVGVDVARGRFVHRRTVAAHARCRCRCRGSTRSGTWCARSRACSRWRGCRCRPRGRSPCRR